MITINLVLSILVLGAVPTADPPNYPNELPGFKLYATAKWNKLVPLQSDFNDVRKVMGDPTNFAEAAGYFYPNQGHSASKTSLFWYDLDDDWQMIVYFVRFDSQDYAKQYGGKIETLDLIPRRAMRMTGIADLAKLKKKHVRAADAAWDEYSDGTGLKYEVYTSKLPSWFKEGPGDLNRVVYGAPDEVVAKAKMKPASVKPVGQDFKVGKADLEVSLVLDKPEIMVGEPLFLSFQVQNRSDQDLQTVQGGDYRNRLGRPESYVVTVMDENGKALPVIDAGQSMGGITGPQKIPAKGTWVRRLFLPNWAKLTAAGDYTITCKTTLKISPHTPGRWDWKEKTTDLAVEVQAKFRVVPQDHQKMEVLIDRLGSTMLGKNSEVSDEATRSLSNIEDDRVIPFFNKAMETKNYSLKFAALDALAKFKSDEALAGLKKGMTTQAADISNTTTEALAAQLASNIRHAAGCALSQSPHPDAKKLLLSMWEDPYNGVRIDVLHALGKMETPESLEMLQKMSHDHDKIVSDEALRYLKARTEKKRP
jgi:hypothetical protein